MVEGKVVNVTDFGLFIDIYQGLEGLAHVSEIEFAGGKLEDHFAVGQAVRGAHPADRGGGQEGRIVAARSGAARAHGGGGGGRGRGAPSGELILLGRG